MIKIIHNSFNYGGSNMVRNTANEPKGVIEYHIDIIS